MSIYMDIDTDIRLRMAVRASGPNSIIINLCVFQNKHCKEMAYSEGDSPESSRE